MSEPLSGKVALVTGASSGIGRAAAEALARAGADVALNYLTMAEGAEAAAAAVRAAGRRAVLCRVDVSDQPAVDAMADGLVKEFGRLDVLVTSAVYSDREPFWTANLDGFRKTIDVSMMGAYYCLRAAARHMVERGEGGSVVVVSSPHAVTAYPNCMAYNMAKAGLDQMARTAALELLKHRVRVNVVYPGWTDTPGERKFFTDEMMDKAGRQLPWGRLATPEEIARGIVFLAEPAADYINGVILTIDGGLHLPWWSRRGTGDF